MSKMSLTTTKGPDCLCQILSPKSQRMWICYYIAVLYVNANHAIGNLIGKSFYTAKALV